MHTFDRFIQRVHLLYEDLSLGRSLESLWYQAREIEKLIGDRNGCLSSMLPSWWYENLLRLFTTQVINRSDCQVRGGDHVFDKTMHEYHHRRFLWWFRETHSKEVYASTLVLAIELYQKGLKKSRTEAERRWFATRIKNFEKRLDTVQNDYL